MANIGQNIRLFREKAGYTQDSFAEAIDVNRVTLSKYESGQSIPGGKIIAKMSQVLHVSADSILGNGEADMTDEEKEIWEFREQLRRDPERRELFHKARYADIEEVRQAVAVLDALKKTKGGD